MSEAKTPSTPEAAVIADVRFIKADDPKVTQTAVRQRGWEYEDEFRGLYGLNSGLRSGDVEIMEPPYLPRTLEALCQQNNTLNVCIAAVVTNIHGTGFDIVAKDEKDAESPRIEEITAFFEETYPGESFRELRRQVGKDLERIGHAYIEVIRNLKGELIFLRRLDPKMMRLVRLDAPKLAKVKISRQGKEFEADVMLRWRRYVQTLNGTNLLYFKEYGCPEPLNSSTGKWDPAVTVQDAASEILYFMRDEDSLTPYGVPAWLAQIPSVLGSRKAEELNLTFFDHGGVPPMMVFVNGGALTPQAADELRRHLQGGSNKHVIPVIETVATGGSMESPGQVKVTVERFGSERQDDSMFENYDERCEKRVRRAWRLPPLFIGATDDYNFASAYASYLVAEAQVFAPERQEFDALINRTLMKELDPEGLFEFRSRPINIKDVDKQLDALQVALLGKTIGRQQLVEIINQMVGFELRLDDDDVVDINAPFVDPNEPPPEEMLPPEQGGGPPTEEEPPQDTPRPGQKVDVARLASEAVVLLKGDASKEQLVALLKRLEKLGPRERQLFQKSMVDLALEGGQSGRHSNALVAHAVMSSLIGRANAAAD